jgi:hypothetical protein
MGDASEIGVALDLWGRHVHGLIEDEGRGDGQRIVKSPARAGK